MEFPRSMGSSCPSSPFPIVSTQWIGTCDSRRMSKVSIVFVDIICSDCPGKIGDYETWLKLKL